MPINVSPAVDFTETDQTNVVPALSTSIGGFAGHLNWGPVEQLVTVSSEKELAKYFGSPVNNKNARSFLTAASFLKYSNALRVSRAIPTSSVNAADAGQILIKNKDHFDTLSSLSFLFSARYPGELGNSITVSYAYVSGSDSGYDSWAYKSLFDGAPNKSLTALANGISTNDEIHLVVIDSEGLISGSKGTVLEKFEGLSLGSNVKNEEGTTLYYKDVINNTSEYIYVSSLASIFDGADEPITESSVFGLIDGAANNESSITLPFNIQTETTVTYPSGNVETTSSSVPTTVTAKSGYLGAAGDNVKFTLRSVDQASAPAKAAYGFIKYGAPVDGDEITVNGDTFTKAAVGSATEFSDITELEALIEAVTGVSSAVVGDYITITADATGVAGNSIDLSLGVGNTGTMEISGSTLRNGVAANSVSYVSGEVNVLSGIDGHVTYDITVSIDNDDATDVTLQNIIDEINFYLVANQISDVEPLSFYDQSGDVLVPNTTDTELVIGSAVILNGNNIKIYTFSGGDSVVYDNDTYTSNISLTGGVDGTAASSDVATALEMFEDKDIAEINLLFAESMTENQSTIDSKLFDIAGLRRDILAAIAAPLEIANLASNAAKKAAVIAKFDSIGSSSYLTFGQTPVYTYNKYSDSFIWIPESGHMMGLCAHTDLVSDPWFSPAGFNRGQLKGVTKIAYNPNKTDRDDLYKKRINSIVSIPGEGIVLIGDKTAQSKPGAFDRINVRRLFNTVERVIINASKYQLFELNDEFTRATFINLVEPFLRDIQGRRGIIDFRVVCDETNNTVDVIDRNEFVGDIYIKPAKSINYIQLNFIATRSGVDFSEIVGG